MKKFKIFTSIFLVGVSSFFICATAFAQTTARKTEVFSPADTLQHLFNLLIEGIARYSFQVLGGIIILIAGWIAANFTARLLNEFLDKRHVDVTIKKFLVSTVKLIVFAFAGLVALGKFGIEIAPFIAGLSVVGFGTSFALQGPLSNYASGASLIFTKPFKVGDIIEVAGVMGEVEDITLPRTMVRTVDGTVIVIPNKHIIGEIIHNYSALKKMDIKMGVGYATDVNRVIHLIKEIVAKDSRISKSKQIKVGIAEFADSSVMLYARLWCKQADYWDVLFDVNQRILTEFQKNKIDIPFPQRVVHIPKEGSF